ncbi:hypothetical protein SLEP1_g3733 [Rubroshorea leprosula]|uniref:Uncharacterized protein n=1 Tax=Rubroshorea leprosula TaxID=152421 RepID=A0AAV5HV84_9ROSI|nr:hypothetical protein SLEP1_g3733 [Rubroshorea leprosula]
MWWQRVIVDPDNGNSTKDNGRGTTGRLDKLIQLAQSFAQVVVSSGIQKDGSIVCKRPLGEKEKEKLMDNGDMVINMMFDTKDKVGFDVRHDGPGRLAEDGKL